eukprot:6374313-Pyramimonas_sp.AAC.1
MTLRTNVATHVDFRGATGCSFQVERGAKQGCPMSGTLVAVCFDSVLRYLHSFSAPNLTLPSPCAVSLTTLRWWPSIVSNIYPRWSVAC